MKRNTESPRKEIKGRTAKPKKAKADKQEDIPHSDSFTLEDEGEFDA